MTAARLRNRLTYPHLSIEGHLQTALSRETRFGPNDAHRDFAMDPSATRFSTVPHMSSGSAPKAFAYMSFGSARTPSCASCVSTPYLIKVPLVPRTLYRIWGERTERTCVRRITVKGCGDTVPVGYRRKMVNCTSGHESCVAVNRTNVRCHRRQGLRYSLRSQ
jgi:hypothetical protein